MKKRAGERGESRRDGGRYEEGKERWKERKKRTAERGRSGRMEGETRRVGRDGRK
jgi:hypothetical protein